MLNTEHNIPLSDGRTLAVLEQGVKSGTPVIYLHGAPGSNKDHSSYTDFYRKQNIHMLAINRPGTGNSMASGHWSALSFADDIKQVMDILAIERANVIGFSAGGLYGCAFASRYPERVSKLGLVSSVGPFDNEALYGKLTEATRMFYDGAKHNPAGLLEQLSAVTTSEAMLALVESLVHAEDKRILNSPAVHDSMLLAFEDVLQQSLEGFVREVFNIATPWGFSASDINAETHIWHGSSDQSVPVECSEYLASAIPTAKVSYIEKAGHYFSFNSWTETLNSILAKH